MAFRMAQDMGLNLDSGINKSNYTNVMGGPIDEKEIDVRRVTFWGCFLFDKCFSNYMGRTPQIPVNEITVPKYDVFPEEDANCWSPYTDNGIGQQHSQPSRTRAVALQISRLCELSSEILTFFYHPQNMERGVGRFQELKKLSEIQTRLENWRKDLPKEFEPKEGQLPNVLLMQYVLFSTSYVILTSSSMFFHLLYIHLFRPFLKYNPKSSPLPNHVSPRKICTQAAGSISKLMRLYKRVYGLRQICNIAVYIVHSACLIHILNLSQEKNAKRDMIHGVKHLEEIAEDWLCARRTLSIISALGKKWGVDLPQEVSVVLARTDSRFGAFSTADIPSPKPEAIANTPSSTSSPTNFQPLPRPQPLGRSQIQLQQSLYNYPIDPKAPLTNHIMNDVSTQSSRTGLQNVVSPQSDHSSINPYSDPRMMTNSSSLHMPPDSGYNPTHTFLASPSQTFNHSITQATSTGDKDTLMDGNRQVSPTAMFGGVEQLVESQDWWLKDQANLAVGFENWMIGDVTSHTYGLSDDLGGGTGNPFYHTTNQNSGSGGGGGAGSGGSSNSSERYGENQWFS